MRIVLDADEIDQAIAAWVQQKCPTYDAGDMNEWEWEILEDGGDSYVSSVTVPLSPKGE